MAICIVLHTPGNYRPCRCIFGLSLMFFVVWWVLHYTQPAGRESRLVVYKTSCYSRLPSWFFLFSSFLFSGSPVSQTRIIKNKKGMEAESVPAGSHVSCTAFFVFQLRIPFYLSSGVPFPRNFRNYILGTLLWETSTISFALFVDVVLFIKYILFIYLLYKKKCRFNSDVGRSQAG